MNATNPSHSHTPAHAPSSTQSPQALHAAMMEAVEHVTSGAPNPPLRLFALVPTTILARVLDNDRLGGPLTAVEQEVPSSIEPGSDELGEYLARIVWPGGVVGAILAQFIEFVDSASSDGDGRVLGSARNKDDAQHTYHMQQTHRAWLVSGAVHEGADLTLLKLKGLEDAADDEASTLERVSLRGGESIAPQVIEALRYSLEYSHR